MGVASRRRPDVSLEVPGEVRLIVEADARRHLRDGLTLEQTPSCRVDAPAEEVAMRSDPEPAGEAPDEMRRRRVKHASRLRQGERPETTLVEEISKIASDVVPGSFRGRTAPLAEMR